MNSPETRLLSLESAPSKALECGCGKRECQWCGGILKLMDAVDSLYSDAARPQDQPFLMPIEDVFSIKGRGTVPTGRVERGVVKVRRRSRNRRPAS